MVMGYERVNCGWLGWLCPLVSILLGGKMRIDRIDRHDCSFYMNEWTAILDLGSWNVGKECVSRWSLPRCPTRLGHLMRFLSSMGIVGRQLGWVVYARVFHLFTSPVWVENVCCGWQRWQLGKKENTKHMHWPWPTPIISTRSLNLRSYYYTIAVFSEAYREKVIGVPLS